jgi:hypothetical protein
MPVDRRTPNGTTVAVPQGMQNSGKRNHPENGSPTPRALVRATPTPDIVSVAKRRCLAIDGAGSPHDPAFEKAVAALFGVSYALKFARKKAGKADFKVGPLESHWSADPARVTTGRPPPEDWRWRLRLGVPDDVTKDEIDRIKRDVVAKKGGKLHGDGVVPHLFLESVPPQRLGRILHVGPYDQEPASLARVSDVLTHAGLTPAPTHIEVYRNDPRRTRPVALETVLLREVGP